MFKEMKRQIYSFYPSEAGIFTEIYLPKKSRFQGTLFDSLSKGLDLDYVKSHFRDPYKQHHIRTLLRKNYKKIAKYDDDFVNNLEDFFKGYSMYEVDGVFGGSTGSVYEERTQVIRIIFLPDLSLIKTKFRLKNNQGKNLKRIRILGKNFFRHENVDYKTFCKNNPELSKKERKYIKYLDNWVDQVGFFLFGYILYEITSKIIMESENGGNNQIEEEIWITSTWGTVINRVKPQ